jgi:hypothetical protein
MIRELSESGKVPTPPRPSRSASLRALNKSYQSQQDIIVMKHNSSGYLMITDMVHISY